MKTEYLIIRRKEKGLTQVEIAKLLGISRATYTGYETGNHDPNPDMLGKLADILDTTTDLLIMRHILPKS